MNQQHTPTETPALYPRSRTPCCGTHAVARFRDRATLRPKGLPVPHP
jgi:hypothetical protein